MECSSCGHGNPETARFCNECGRPLAVSCARSPAPEPRSYTPKHLVEKILHSRSAIEGERKQVTVLFADVKGSMELAQQVGPEEWHALLDRFFQLLTENVHLFEGTVNQYTGDGIMALFGAPIAHEDHAQRACHAALHIRDALKRYADELRMSRGLNFSVRMGLHSGEVVVGTIGDDLRMDYTARGHTVGLAQRMEQIAEPGHAYLTERTAALVEGFFELRDVGTSRVKGSRDPVRVYALEKHGALRTRFDVARARGFSKFVGRAAELRVLESALEDALQGKGRVIGVVAEPGIGKSRLCYEFAERCRARGVAVFEAHGTAHGRQMPMLPILELLRSFFGIGDEDSGRTAREKIAGRLLLLGEDLREELPLVFDLMGVPDPAELPEPIDPEAHHRRILRAIQRTVFASTAPAVILIEDLHWLDAASDGILAQIVEATAASARLVVVNFRPEYSAAWTEEPHYEQLSLRRLDSAAIRELLGELLGSDPSVERLPRLIQARTGGNPFFVEEVVQMLADTGVLVGSRGAWKLARPVTAIAVPESVRAVLASRIDRLGEPEKRVLQAAAVIGKQVPLPLLARAVQLPERELGSVLSRLREAEFLYEARLSPHIEYAFKHPLTEAVALESQLRSQRAAVHAAVARAIEEFERDRLDEQAARLAYHWEAADEALEAARWHRRAAEWIGLAEPSEALRHWRRVRRLARQLDSPVAAELLALACHQTLNLAWRLDLSDEEMRLAVAECRESAGRVDPALVVRVLCAYAVCQNFRGAFRDNVRPLTEALRIATAERSTDMEIDVLLTLQGSMGFLGRLEEAERYCTRVIDLVGGDVAHVNFGGTSSYLESLAIRGLVRAERGRHREALEDIELALRLSDVPSWRENLLIALRAAVHSAELVGAVQGSLPRARRLAQLAVKGGSPLWTIDASLCTGIAHVGNQRWDDAIGVLEHVVLRIDERGFARHDLGRALTALAKAYLGAGRPADAVRAAERAVRTSRTRGTKGAECMARIVLAKAQLAKEGVAARRKARAGLARVERLVKATGARAHRPFACEVRAVLARTADDAGAARSALREAHRLFAAMGATGHAERVAQELAELRGGRRNAPEAP